MSDNFNSSLNSSLNNPFAFNVLPERTMKQVKDSAVNLLKNVVKPITDIGSGKEDIISGKVGKQIDQCNKMINLISNITAASDPKNRGSLNMNM